MKYIHAYTGPTGPGYPAFYSLNEQDDGTFTLDVRTAGAQNSSRIALTREQLVDLALGILDGIDPRPVCQLPPPGWKCSRIGGHPGPCAASPA